MSRRMHRNNCNICLHYSSHKFAAKDMKCKQTKPASKLYGHTEVPCIHFKNRKENK